MTAYTVVQTQDLSIATNDRQIVTETGAVVMNANDVAPRGRVAPGSISREVTNQTSFRDDPEGEVMISTGIITLTTVELMNTTGMVSFPPFIVTGGGVPGTKWAARSAG